jgi:putative aminopeptidase FrvX
MNRNKLLSGLQRLTTQETAPFDEHETRAALHDWLAELKIPYEVDAFGNTLTRVRHGHPRRQIAFVAHLDHPAFRVASIQGRQVHCLCEGGLPAHGLRNRKVHFPRTAHGLIKGTVESIKIERHDRHRLASAVIRIAARDPLPEQGDFAVLALPALKRAGNRLKLRAADDLTGTAAIVAALADLSNATTAVDALGVFTRAEEVGLYGAIALAIEGRLSRDTTVVSVECSQVLGEVKLGKGPVVRLGDQTGPFDPRACALVAGAARDLGKKLAFQTALLPSGTCEATVFSAFGYSAAGIALPLAAYHNQGPRGVAPEEIDLRDLEGAVRLITASALRAGAGIEDLDLLRNDLVLSSQEGRDRMREPIDPTTGYPRTARF